jgi:hypothetical protein
MIAAALSGMAILAGCGSTHTKTVTRTKTVTHVLRAHRKIIHRTKTVTVSRAPTPTQTTATTATSQNTCPASPSVNVGQWDSGHQANGLPCGAVPAAAGTGNAIPGEHPCGVPLDPALEHTPACQKVLRSESGCGVAGTPSTCQGGQPLGCTMITPATYQPAGAPGKCSGIPVGKECC